MTNGLVEMANFINSQELKTTNTKHCKKFDGVYYRERYHYIEIILNIKNTQDLNYVKLILGDQVVEVKDFLNKVGNRYTPDIKD